MLKTLLRLVVISLLATAAELAMAQEKPVYRCPGPPVIYTDAITPAEAAARMCRGIEGDRWIEAGRDNASVVYIDSETISRTGRVMRVWLKRVYAKPVVLASDRTKTFISTKELALFNCEERSIANIQQLRYSNAEGLGAPVEATVNPEITARFRALVPESFDERILSGVCAAQRK